QLFPQKFPANKSFSQRKLSKSELQEFKRALEAEATWCWDKECDKLTKNKRLKEAINKRRAVNNTIKYIPHHYYKNHLSDLQEILKNPNLRSVWVAANSENNDAAFWSKVSQLGLIHFFSLLSESSREYEIFKKAFSGLSIQRIRQIRKTDSSAVTNPDLILDNFMKFAELVKKLVYSEDLNYITGSTLPHDETTISSIDDIHPKINYILQNDAVATQVRAIALKVSDESADQISNLLREVIELANVANLNILSFGSDGARSEFNAQSIIMNEASGFLEYKDAFYNINFKAPIYEGKPFIRVQDPKHAKKTARLLSLGISTMHYDQLFELAH
ncbi:10484_t:CDS:2, partial [Entrophospora sp. SA101]